MSSESFSSGMSSDEGLFAIRGNLDGDSQLEFSEKEQFLGLIVTSEVFLLHISSVNEIVMLEPIRYVPGAPKFVEGVVNLRGTILPVLNLRRMFGHARGDVTPATRIVIVQAGSQAIGLLVDGISTVFALLPSEMAEHVFTGKGAGVDLISKVSKHHDRILGILDLDKIVNIAGEGRVAAEESA
jgi:purine-binding chemotaxis protein CheW